MNVYYGEKKSPKKTTSVGWREYKIYLVSSVTPYNFERADHSSD